MARRVQAGASGSVFVDIVDLYGGRGGRSSSPLPFTANPVCAFTLGGGGARLLAERSAGDPGTSGSFTAASIVRRGPIMGAGTDT